MGYNNWKCKITIKCLLFTGWALLGQTLCTSNTITVKQLGLLVGDFIFGEELNRVSIRFSVSVISTYIFCAYIRHIFVTQVVVGAISVVGVYLDVFLLVAAGINVGTVFIRIIGFYWSIVIGTQIILACVLIHRELVTILIARILIRIIRSLMICATVLIVARCWIVVINKDWVGICSVCLHVSKTACAQVVSQRLLITYVFLMYCKKGILISNKKSKMLVCG